MSDKLSPSALPRARDDREKVETARQKNKDFLWIDRKDDRSEPLEMEARRHYSARIAAHKQQGLKPEAAPDAESLPDPANLRATQGYELAFDTIGLRLGANGHAKPADSSSLPSNLQRHIAHKICASLTQEIIDNAVAQSHRNKTLLRYVPHAPTGLRRTHDWPSTSRYEERTLFLLPLAHPVRLMAIAISESSVWNAIFSVVVMVSCILIALDDPFEADYYPYQVLYGQPSQKTATLNQLNFVITLAFVGEFVVNVMAQGLVLGSRTYLMDYWNQIDFLVVVSGVVEIASTGGPNLKALRSIKVGRILLYAIRRVPDVRILVELLGRLAEPLSAAFLLNVMVLLLSALFMQQLFGSAGGARCHGVNTGLPIRDQRACSPSQNQALGINKCASPVGPGGGIQTYMESCYDCEAYHSCVLEATVRVPVTGRTYSFDDYANALVATIQMYTLSGWGAIAQGEVLCWLDATATRRAVASSARLHSDGQTRAAH